MTTSLSQETINEFVVASHFDLPKVKELLAHHPDLLNENAEWIETPIQAAAHVNNRDIIEYLLEQGAPLDICTAAVLGRLDDLRALLAEAPELKDAHGSHNLHVLFYAALGDSIPVAEALVEAGAQVNAEGSQAALIGAVLGGSPTMVRWLLDRDADPYATDFNGRTALEVAEDEKQEEIAEMLRPFYVDEDERER